MPQLKISVGTLTQKGKEIDMADNPVVKQQKRIFGCIKFWGVPFISCVILGIVLFVLCNSTQFMKCGPVKEVGFVLPCGNVDQITPMNTKESSENSKSDGTVTEIQLTFSAGKDDELRTVDNSLLQTTSESDVSVLGTPLEVNNDTDDKNDFKAWQNKVRLVFPVNPKPDEFISFETELVEDMSAKPRIHTSDSETRHRRKVFSIICFFLFMLSISLNMGFLYLLWIHCYTGTCIMDTLLAV